MEMQIDSVRTEVELTVALLCMKCIHFSRRSERVTAGS